MIAARSSRYHYIKVIQEDIVMSDLDKVLNNDNVDLGIEEVVNEVPTPVDSPEDTAPDRVEDAAEIEDSVNNYIQALENQEKSVVEKYKKQLNNLEKENKELKNKIKKIMEITKN